MGTYQVDKQKTCQLERSLERMDILWKDYFRDSISIHRTRHASLSFDSPSWVLEELCRREVSKPENAYLKQKEKQIRNQTHGEDILIVALLKDCIKKKDIFRGIKIHADIAKKGLFAKSPYIASMLISMYTKCGMLSKAQQVLEEIPIRDVVTWSALIAGYAQQGQGMEAMDCFECMQNEGISPNAVTFSSVLKACGILGDLRKGKDIHDEILRMGFLGNDVVLGNALVDMYVKCDLIDNAQEVLEGLTVRNVVTWSTLIAGYAQWGRSHEALNCFERMQGEGLSPNSVTYICILKACGNIGDIGKGKQIHDEIMRMGLLWKDIMLGTALVDMYVKCGLSAKAQEILEELPIRDVVSWSVLISGYAQEGHCQEALKCLEYMQSEGLFPNPVTFIGILKACCSTGSIEKGEQIHEEIVNRGFLHKDIALGNALVDMYSKCNQLAKAQQVLEELPARDVISWNSLIAGYAQHGKCNEALTCLELMQGEGTDPNDVTFVCILNACGSMGDIDKGKIIHENIVCRGFPGNDMALGNALVAMHAKCGMLVKAKEVLEELPVRDVVSWNALIAGYAQQGRDHDALNCFEQMQSHGLSPDAITFIGILKAYGSTGAVEKGKQIHMEIVNRGLLEMDIVLANALMDMYARCGFLTNAHRLLEELPVRDAIAWNTLITGYVQEGQNHEALNCFENMKSEGVYPNAATFVCCLKACGSIGAKGESKKIHETILNRGMLKRDIMLSNALVDMYAKCGMLEKALDVLEELPFRNVVSWNVLIAGYALQGQVHKALSSFDRLLHDGISPDEVTFVCVLSACNRSGLLSVAQAIFRDMTIKYGITPNLEHHCHILMLLASAGHFDKAMSVINMMPRSDYPAVWLTLLSACRKWGNLTLGRLVFDQAVQLDDRCGAAYALMVGIFAEAGLREDAVKIEAMRLKKYGPAVNE